MDEISVGCVVYSLSGRDSGRYYVIVKLEDGYAYIVDGNLRKLKNPKKKNMKHLRSSGRVLTTIADKFNTGKKVFDTEVNSALREFNDKGMEV
ncbi:MAG: KOW domain-containing RNA-binding protein [Clostridia bacterium]|nr:KOW domain-containing RNA-binding protein [Clostridia bacterium]